MKEVYWKTLNKSIEMLNIMKMSFFSNLILIKIRIWVFEISLITKFILKIKNIQQNTEKEGHGGRLGGREMRQAIYIKSYFKA